MPAKPDLFIGEHEVPAVAAANARGVFIETAAFFLPRELGELLAARILGRHEFLLPHGAAAQAALTAPVSPAENSSSSARSHARE